MADEKTLQDSVVFSAMAGGIFDAATDAPSARDALVEAYNSAQWTNPEETKKDLEYYGKAVKNKLNDTSSFSPEVLTNEAPIPLDRIAITPEQNERDRLSIWEQKNQEYLDSTEEPDLLAAKEQWKTNIKDYASQARREDRFAEQKKSLEGMSSTEKQKYELLYGAEDLGARALRGASSLVQGPVKWTTGYDTRSHLTEYTNPDKDSAIIGKLAEAAGNAGATIAGFAIAAPVGIAGLVSQGTDLTLDRYNKTLETTGDETAAREAAAIEAASQTGQALAGKLVFGSLANKFDQGFISTVERAPAGSLLETAGRGVATVGKATKDALVNKETLLAGEAGAIGSFTSSYAEDLQTGANNLPEDKRPTLGDKAVQAVESGAINAVVAGGAHAVISPLANASAANAAVKAGRVAAEARANNNAKRSAEIEELGYPVTPTVKQVIGHTFPEDNPDTQSIAAETNVDRVELTDPQQLAPQQEVTVEEKAPIPVETVAEKTAKEALTPAFKTEDGTSYVYTEEGKAVPLNDAGVAANAHDKVTYLGEAEAQKIGLALSIGDNVVLNDDGKVAINHVITPGKPDAVQEVVTTSDTPAEGLYPLSISSLKTANIQSNELPIALGAKITSVIPFDNTQSVGAGFVTNTGGESEFSRRIKQNPVLAKTLADAGIDQFSALNPLSIEGLNRQVTEYANAKGGIGALLEVISGTSPDANVNDDVNFRNATSTYLHNYLQRESRSGDPDRVTTANAILKAYGQQLSDVRSAQGRAFFALQGIEKNEDSAARVAKTTIDTYEKEVAQIAEEEGATPEEVKKAPILVQTTTKEVEAATAELQNAEKVEGSPVTNEETQAEDQAVTDIETQAQEKLATDLNNIDQETQDLSEEVRATEKRAERQKRKDIARVEEAIALDGEKLANAINDSIDLTDITTEEKAKLEEKVNESLKALEEKTNADTRKDVAEKRKNRAEASKSALERANDILTRANESLAKNTLKTNESLRKLEYEAKELEKAKKDSSSVRKKIKAVNDSLTNAKQRVADAKQRIEELHKKLSPDNEENIQEEEILKELESGVQIAVVPRKGRRDIAFKTKKSGLDISKLYKKSKELGIPLGALSQAVNDLAGVVRQSLGARAKSNEALNAIEKRIEQNKKALDAAKVADALGAAERKRVDAARKRLEQLAKAKSEATLESRVSPRTKKLYRELKDRQSNRPKTSNSEAIKEAARKLNEARAKQRRALKLLEKQKLAKQLAAEAAKHQDILEGQIEALDRLLKDPTITGSKRAEIEMAKAAKVAEATNNAGLRDSARTYWVGNLVGNFILPQVALVGGGIEIGAAAAATAIPSSIKPIFKNLAAGEFKYKLPFLSLVAGALDKANFKRTVDAVRAAVFEGKRIHNTIDKEKITAKSRITYYDTRTDLLTRAADFLDLVKNLGYVDGKQASLARRTLSLAYYPAAVSLRALMGTEALISGIHYNAVEHYAQALEHNKDVAAGLTPEQIKVKYADKTKQNWEVAKAQEAAETKKIADAYKAAGLPVPEVSKHASTVRAIEIFREMSPESSRITAYKQAAQIVRNGPAGGMAGWAADLLQKVIRDFDGDAGDPQTWKTHASESLKYVTAFSNAIAHALNVAVSYTPFGLIDVYGPSKKANLTDAEKSLRISQAITGTALAAGIAIKAAANLSTPEKDRAWDIYGAKGDSLGEHKFSVRVGNYYIPYALTPFAPGLAAAAYYKERVASQKLKPEDAVVAITIANALPGMTMASLKSIGQMSMLGPLNQLGSALGDLIDKQNEPAAAKLVTLLSSYVKGHIPSYSFWKTVSKYTDSPVDARNDILSALVAGFPVVQSLVGKPALNGMGEYLQRGEDPTGGVSRIFSQRADDIDFRWLATNGYSLPESLSFTDSQKKQAGAKSPDSDLKYDAFHDSAKQIRAIVSATRQSQGNAAYSKAVQESLNERIKSVLNYNLAIRLNQRTQKK